MGEPGASFQTVMAQLVQQLSTSISESEDLQAALASVVRQICELTGWDYGEAWLPSDGGEVLRPSAVWYAIQPDAWTTFRDATEGLQCRPGDDLIGRVWQSNQAEWLPDVSGASSIPFGRQAVAQACQIQEGMAVPIGTSGWRMTAPHPLPVAVLAFFRTTSGDPDPRRMERVQAIAEQLGPILQLKHTQTEQAKHQQQLMQLIDALPGIIFSGAPEEDWPMRYMSQGCLALTGYDRSEIAGPNRTLSYTDITHPDDRTHMLQTITDAVNAHQPYVVEYRIFTKDGQLKWLWEKGYGVYDAVGNVVGIEGFITDTTDRRQMEEALRGSEARFRNLFYGASIGICYSTRPGFVGDCNPAYEAMLGYTTNEARSLRISQVTHPDDLATDMALYQEMLSGERDSYQLEKRFIHKDGHVMWGKLTVFMTRDPEGFPKLLFAFIEDISQHKLAEAALKRSQDQSRQLLQAIPEMLFVVDANGIFRYVQAEDPTDLVLPPDEMIGRALSELLPPDVAHQARRACQTAANTQSCQTLEYELWVQANELRSYEARVSPYDDDAFVMTVRNISAQKQAIKSIQDKEAFLRLILDSIPQYIFWKDRDLVYRGANQHFAESVGLDSPAELVGKTDFDLWDEAQAELYRSRDRQVLDTHKPLLNTIRKKVLPTGQVQWLNIDKVPIHDAEGQVIGVLGAFEDITEQRRVGESLARRQQYLSVLVDLQTALLSADDVSQVSDDFLATLGRVSGASRVYLFENSWDEQGLCLMNQRQEWCADGIETQLDNPVLQALPYSEVSDTMEQLLASGEAYSGLVKDLPERERQILEPQGILSILLLPLLVHEQFYGFIGLDNCRVARVWDPAEVDLLRAATASLSLALERQGAIAAVQENEARYRLLADYSNDVISRHSTQGQCLYVSPACTPLLGYTPEDLYQRSLLDYIHPDDVPLVEQMHEMALHTEAFEVTPYSYRFRHKRGDYIWLETCSQAVANGHTGEPQEIISVSRDVTERHRANELLNGQKRVLELIARDRSLADTLHELLDIIQMQNPGSLASILRVAPDQHHIGEVLSLNLPAEYQAALPGIEIGPNVGTCGTAMYFGRTVISSDIETDPLWDGYRDLVLPHGLRSCWSSPIISSQGQVLGSFALYYRTPHTPTSEEIQLVEMARQMAAIAIERKLASEALQRAEAKYRSIFENAVEGIFQSTVEGQYAIVNPMLASIYGYHSPDDLIRSMQDIGHQLYVTPERRDAFVRQIEEQGIIQGFESQVYRKDGSIIWISECARALRDEAGHIIGYEGTVEDITQRKQAQDELIRRDNLLQGIASATHHLLTTTEFSIAIQKVLTILGESAGVDRTYLYEHHPNLYNGDVSISIRYEWSSPNASSLLQSHRWKNLSYQTAQLNHWQDAFQQGKTIAGITRQLSEAEQSLLLPDQVKSTLRVPIFVNQELWGHIGFDDCRDERVWTASEESMLVAIAASIGGAIQRQRTEEQMRYQAFHDSLTGLPNRMFFDHRLNLALAHSRRAGETFAVMFLDLDRFKTINDTLGHAVGDDLLKLTTQRLNLCLREEDTIARWGGDEFTLLLPNLSSPEDAAKVAHRIANALKPIFRLEGHDLHITCSLGIAIYPQDGRDANTLLKHADVALYRAKEEGRNNYQFYTAALNSRASERLTLDNSLHQALERGEFVLYYQPQHDLQSGAVIQMEALVRWQHPKLGLVSPQTFIPLAEENGLILPIGDWVLHQACTQLKQWHDLGCSDLRVAINLSPHQFQQANLVERIQQVLQANHLHPSMLEIEITESIFMKDVESVRTILKLLREMGVRVALDDFGTGYSSLCYLREFPLTTLKIDQSFTRTLLNSSQAIAIIDAIITLGRGLDLSVVAEGVETEEQREQLQALQCTEMQGYLFSKPLNAKDALDYLQQHCLKVNG